MKVVKAKLPDIRSFHRNVEVVEEARDILAMNDIYYEGEGGQTLSMILSNPPNRVCYVRPDGDDWFMVSMVPPSELPALFDNAVEEAERNIETERHIMDRK